MNRVRRLLLVLTATAGILAAGAIAWAYFSAAGTGSASASVTSLSAPTGVNAPASVSGSTVHVSWTGVTAPDGSSTVAYWVQRYAGSTPTDACGSSHASPIAIGTGAKSCDDTGVASGTFTYRVAAVFRSWTAASAASGSVVVNNSTLDHFAVSAPGSATAGTAFSVTVSARDASNNIFTAYTGMVHFSTSDANSPVLPGNYTFVAGDSGSHTFTTAVTLKTAGSSTVSVNDTAQVSKTGASGAISVAAAGLDHFVVTAPASATAATAFTTATVTAQDLYNNPASGWTSPAKCITFSGPGSAPNGTAPNYPPQGSCSAGQSSLTFNSSGVAGGFSITLYKAETVALTATDPSSSKTATSSNIVVAPASALSFAVAAPTTATAGTQFSVTSLTARDAYSNTVTGYTGSHTIAWSGPGTAPSGATPTFPTTSVAFTNGVSTTTLNTTLVKAESPATLTASETSGPSGSASITVSPAPTSKFLVSGSTATAGVQFATSLTATDTFNNTTPSYTGPHTITWSGPNNAPNGTAPTFPTSSVTFANGLSTTALNATLVKAESATLTASATTPTATGSATITVSPATASNFLFNTPATTAVAGNPFAVATSLTARDAFNNVATGYTNSHTITWSGASNSPSGATPTFTSSVAFTAGVSATPLTTTLVKAESATLTASATTPTATGSATITVSPATGMGLTNCVVQGTPQACNGTYALGNGGTMTAQISLTTDPFGNAPTNTTVAINVTSSSPSTYAVTSSPAQITNGVTSTLFTVTKNGNANNSTTITAHATSGPYPDLAFTVKK